MQGLEKILEEIENERESYEAVHVKSYEKGLRFAAEAIRKHMNDSWTPVEERLPIPNKEVWVTVKRNGKVFIATDGMTEKGHFWNYEKENILAWKEKDIIPEPYRPKKRQQEWKDNFMRKFDKRT